MATFGAEIGFTRLTPDAINRPHVLQAVQKATSCIVHPTQPR